ncbi:hypothetical protein BayCH28_06255 [Mycolicibacterium sp. CH28]|uniref:hypothetical protein n=1 Tax=Mycolicibacterium sp. CH28 TaxID=2512237 RepID=UPI001080DF28|nr:hypothetical protein [Mycolicibacterium sp. CH28]TGD88981.1 hypothetical protein BayCH28_06255 [Mycolicibacterium sp. CH28]
MANTVGGMVVVTVSPCVIGSGMIGAATAGEFSAAPSSKVMANAPIALPPESLVRAARVNSGLS